MQKNFLDSTLLPFPWHERRTSLEDERRYLNLVETHGLTQVWLTEIAPSVDSEKQNLHRIERTLRPELSQSLWLLEKIKLDQLPPRLSTLIDSTTTEEFLSELEETIWIVQTTTLENAMEATADRIGLLNLLEKASWNYGKKVAEKRWPNFESRSPMDCFNAFLDSPLASPQGFLLESHHAKECSFYWLSSPLSRASILRSPVILELCRLHHEFMRGYFYTLCRNLRVHFTPSAFASTKTFRITLEQV